MTNQNNPQDLDLSAFIENETRTCIQCGSELVTAIGTINPLCIDCPQDPKPPEEQK